ncbi:MAG: monovalent cation/H+ antiporter subunit D family protein [Immundisolibacterales bacterium]|nr:monovalent cation/H+ antiporter subunit D family protein [Immundisolibacterales bacterium]
MIASHLPALQVVVPLVAAPVCVLLRWSRVAWMVAMAASLFAVGGAWCLLAGVLSAGPTSYFLGSWAAPWGIEYRVDETNAWVMLVVSVISAVSLLFARRSVEREVETDRIHLFYTAWLLCLAGLLGMAVTADAFNVFVFLEISSLSTYVLVSLGTRREALVAALRYLVLGTVGATFFLIGVGLLYQVTGTLNMGDLATRIAQLGPHRTVTAAFGFLAVGIAVKSAVYPLHTWLPNAYAFAPSAVSAFLAGTATKVSLYLLLRFLFTVFGHEFVAGGPVPVLLALTGVAAVVAASVAAVRQDDAKRLLGFSSVAQIGYLVLGVSLLTTEGVAASLIHLFGHALMKTALFVCLGAIVYRIGSARIDDMAGIAKRMPWTCAALVVGGLSLIGVPLTAGFVGKWYLVAAALEAGWWPVAAAMLLASLIAVAYVWKLVESAYFRAPSARVAAARGAPFSMVAAAWGLSGANIWFGIDTSLPIGVANRAAAALLGG